MIAGELSEVVAFDGLSVAIRSCRSLQSQVLSIAKLVAEAQFPRDAQRPAIPPSVALSGLTARQYALVVERAGHVREVLTGFRSGHPPTDVENEPRPAFAPQRSLYERYEAKAGELGVSQRTVQRWVSAYQDAGEAGLVDTRVHRRMGGDPRWEEAVRLVAAEAVGESTPTIKAFLFRVEQWLAEQHGRGAVELPSRATAYRRVPEILKGTNAVRGSAKGRRSIAARPSGTYGRLRATRPGEYLILDTQDLDVFALEPVTCRWVPAQLTVAMDLYTRAVLGLTVTPGSTKAVDVAGVLYQCMTPLIVEDSGDDADGDAPPQSWPFHGVPEVVVFSEAAIGPTGTCLPETLVVDHGKVFLSQYVMGVCARLGISVQPAQVRKPTDKPTVERFFRTLREGLIQHLPAYKGPDVYGRGDRVEDAAFLYLGELEAVIREWVGRVYHQRPHDGLVAPEYPTTALSPTEMYAAGVARAGLLRIPPDPDLLYSFMRVEWRTVQHYGIEVGGLRYNGAALDGYRNVRSPYGGKYAGKWPIHLNADDVRAVYFQDPQDQRWHRLDWEHAPSLDTPFSADAAAVARRLTLRGDRFVDESEALRALLERWQRGAVENRRERIGHLRLATQYRALPLPPSAPPAREAQPSTGASHQIAHLAVDVDVEPIRLDDDLDDELEDSAEDAEDDASLEDYYGSAFEVLK